MSQHSALASLTAQYTDSEEEIEGEEAGDGAAEGAGQVIVRNPSPLPEAVIAVTTTTVAPAATSLNVNLSGSRPSSVRSTTTESVSVPVQQAAPSSSLGGLVSYQVDLIDDEAIDDVYNSDSNTTTTGGQDDLMEEEGQVSLHLTPETEDISIAAGGVATPEEGKEGGEIVETLPETESVENGISPKKKCLLPPEVTTKCPAELQEKFAKMHEKKVKSGLDMNMAIQRNKNFRNPSIYEKLIKYCDLDELGSNYAPNVFDPHEWHESSYYDELAKAQKDLMEKREKERKERTKVEFVSGTVKKPVVIPQDSEPKRKSKWDQRGVMPPLLLPTAYAQPPSVVPPLTTAPTGTKSTVINAFGSISINKKPK